MHSVFISYSSADSVTAQKICKHLEDAAIKCWIAPRDVLPGSDYGDALLSAIESCILMLVILSQESMKSPQVLREVERAISKGAVLLPVRVDKAPLTKSMEFFLSASHWYDMSSGTVGSHLEHIVDTVRKQLKMNEGPAREVISESGPVANRNAWGRVALWGAIPAVVIIVILGWYLHDPKQMPSPGNVQSFRGADTGTYVPGSSSMIDSRGKTVTSAEPTQKDSISALPIARSKQPGKAEAYRDSLAAVGKFDVGNRGLHLEAKMGKGGKAPVIFEDDSINLFVKSNKACNVRVVYRSKDNNKYLITYPQSLFIDSTKANKNLLINIGTCAGPFGVESIVVTASLDKLDDVMTEKVGDYYILREPMSNTRGIRLTKRNPFTQEMVIWFTTQKRGR